MRAMLSSWRTTPSMPLSCSRLACCRKHVAALNTNENNSHVLACAGAFSAAPRVLRTQGRNSGRVHAENGVHEANGNGSRSSDEYDLVVIGGGSAGTRVARASAKFGAKVALCELPFAYTSAPNRGGLGGTCVLRGCVPKKLMLFATEFNEYFRDSAGFGWDVSVNGLDWSKFMDKKRHELQRLSGRYGEMLDDAGVKVYQGRATLRDRHTVDVDGQQLKARNIVIATGSTPNKIPIDGAEHCITSDDVLELDELPRKLLIVGAGYIGIEFAGIFNRAGVETHIAFRGTTILTGFDCQVQRAMTDGYRAAGVKLHCNTSPKSVRLGDNGAKIVTLEDSEKKSTREETFDVVLMATGRKPNTKDMGLEALGVEMTKKGGIVVDKYSRSTTVDNIFALGDVTERKPLTPVALMEGMALARYLFGDDSHAAPDYDCVPSAVFGQPPLAFVGLTEEAATEKVGDVDVYSTSFRPLRNTVSGNNAKSFCKIIVDATTDKVVGIHMIDSAAPEIIQGMAAAVKMGITKKQLDSVVGVHPTAAEELVTMHSPSKRIRNKQEVALEPETAAAK